MSDFAYPDRNHARTPPFHRMANIGNVLRTFSRACLSPWMIGLRECMQATFFADAMSLCSIIRDALVVVASAAIYIMVRADGYV